MSDYGPGEGEGADDASTGTDQCPNMGDCEGEVYGGGPCDVCDAAGEVGGWDSGDSGGCEGTGGA